MHIWNGKELVIDDGHAAFRLDNGRSWFDTLLCLAFRKVHWSKIKHGAGGLGST